RASFAHGAGDPRREREAGLRAPWHGPSPEAGGGMNRPLDPTDLIAQGIAETSGCSIEVARTEALPLLAYLEDHGARISYDLALPERAPAGKRETSRKAAESQGDL